jgi:hypothetical protein
MRAELDMAKAKAKRANDFIDAQLKRDAAETDVVQSAADASRNVTSGVKNLMTSEGKAKETAADGVKSKLSSEGKASEEKASSWFGGWGESKKE